MKFVAQRVLRGLVVYFGVGVGDTEEKAVKCAEKLANLRVFADEAGKMNRSVRDIGGEVLLVSQFTLYGDVRRGNRPSFDGAEESERANALYELALTHLEECGVPVKGGVFGADMQIEQLNDGPVTVIYEL